MPQTIYNLVLKNNIGKDWYQISGTVFPVSTEVIYPIVPDIISNKTDI